MLSPFSAVKLVCVLFSVQYYVKKRKILKNILQCFVLKQRHFLLFFLHIFYPHGYFDHLHSLWGKCFFVKVQPVDFSVLGISAQLNDTNKSPFLLQTCLV